ncbi:GPI mannosyltransferase 4 [Discoglossus pictus]
MGGKKLWVMLSLLRIVWCLVPQWGYLHPDEFFQSPEVMAGDILNLDTNRPWEFLPGSPCRTVVIPLLTTGAIFWIIGLLQHIGITPLHCSYLLLVLPRLLITLLSFLMDYSVYQIAPHWGANRWKAMVLLAGSYVTLVFYTRTFSNAVEGILFALILLLTSPQNYNKQWKTRTSHVLGVLLTVGFFNRLTFLGFAFMPLLYWAQQNNQTYKSLITNVLKLLPSVTLTTIIFTAADTLYYTGNNIFANNSVQRFTENLNQNIVLTPLNFLRYNLNPQNLAQHGTHPLFTHVLVNGVMLFGFLHVSVVLCALKMMKRYIAQLLGKNHSSTEANPPKSSLLLVFYFVPLALLSVFSHQEPRFLIPLILPLVLLAASHNIVRHGKCVLVVFNIFGALFFGCLHQAGLVPSLFHIQQTIKSSVSPGSSSVHYTLLFTHTYMPPKYLLCLKKEQTSVELIDLAGFKNDQLCQKLLEIKENLLQRNMQLSKEKIHHLLIVFPGTITAYISKCELVYNNVTLFSPHLSMEDPPQVSNLFSGNMRSLLGLYVIDIDVDPLR